jgi:hypothetical protein
MELYNKPHSVGSTVPKEQATRIIINTTTIPPPQLNAIVNFYLSIF